MKKFFLILFFLLPASSGFAGPGISPSLYFAREGMPPAPAGKVAPASGTADVTIRFESLPNPAEIRKLESLGVSFSRANGDILHIGTIYPATVILDSLEAIASFPGILRIEDAHRPVTAPTLDVSNPEVQASRIWDLTDFSIPIDGSGVVVANIDTGIDIYHPAFFKADGGEYSWLDVNGNSFFDPGVDAVDLNGNDEPDPGETLSFYDAPLSDKLDLVPHSKDMYDADLDWLYNDSNRNGARDYGPEAGYGEDDLCFGERIFIIADPNRNNRLDPGETLTGLGTSKVIAIFDKNGAHYRGKNLMTNTGDRINHGTGSSGIAGGQQRGRRFTGMAPGVEFIAINRTEVKLEEAIAAACSLGTDIFMYEYGSWIFEFLDGSSNVEVMIDNLYRDGYHQFTASGNLAGPARRKHAKLVLKPSSTETLPFTVPDSGIKQVYLSILWRSDSRPALSLNLPGYTAPLTGDARKRNYGPYSVASGIDTSPAGTWKMDVIIASDANIAGDMQVELQNRSRDDITINAYIADNAYRVRSA